MRGQDGQNETEQPDHSASLGDSITSSTRIRFSVHTRPAWMGKPYSIDLRERVVAAGETGGMSCHRAAAQFGVGVNTAFSGCGGSDRQVALRRDRWAGTSRRRL